MNWLSVIWLVVLLVNVGVHGFLEQSEPLVMKTLNLHGDRISDLEISVRRLLAANQDLQKTVADLQSQNTALKAAVQMNSQNCCCNSKLPDPCATSQNTSTTDIIPTSTYTSQAKTTTNFSVTTSQAKTNNAIDTSSKMTLTPASAPFIMLKTTTSTTTHSEATTTTKSATTSKSTTRPSSTTSKRTTSPGSTSPVPYTIPPNPTTCFLCLDDAPDLCDVLYVEEECKPPNNYCINEVKNFADGSKTINRTCGNIDTCYNDWYHGSSKKDVCQNFDESQYITLDFECVYCCVKDGCNYPMKPDADTLYEDN